MMKSKRRPNVVQTTLNDEELAALRKQAEKEGVTPTAFLRQLVIKNVPCVIGFEADRFTAEEIAVAKAKGLPPFFINRIPKNPVVESS